jgi:hypothetical protein
MATEYQIVYSKGGAGTLGRPREWDALLKYLSLALERERKIDEIHRCTLRVIKV